MAHGKKKKKTIADHVHNGLFGNWKRAGITTAVIVILSIYGFWKLFVIVAFLYFASRVLLGMRKKGH